MPAGTRRGRDIWLPNERRSHFGPTPPLPGPEYFPPIPDADLAANASVGIGIGMFGPVTDTAATLPPGVLAMSRALYYTQFLQSQAESPAQRMQPADDAYCSAYATKFLIWSPWGAGPGSELKISMMAMTAALLHNRTVVFTHWFRNYGDWAATWPPLGRCNVDSVRLQDYSPKRRGKDHLTLNFQRQRGSRFGGSNAPQHAINDFDMPDRLYESAPGKRNRVFLGGDLSKRVMTLPWYPSWPERWAWEHLRVPESNGTVVPLWPLWPETWMHYAWLRFTIRSLNPTFRADVFHKHYRLAFAAPLGDAYRQVKSGNWTLEASPELALAAVTPPRHMICIHVRHGDKVKEMKLLALRKYLDAAERMRKETPSLTSIFILSNDKHVYEAMSSPEITNRWKVYWYWDDIVIASKRRMSRGRYAAAMRAEYRAAMGTVLLAARYCTHYLLTERSGMSLLIKNIAVAVYGKAGHAVFESLSGKEFHAWN